MRRRALWLVAASLLAQTSAARGEAACAALSRARSAFEAGDETGGRAYAAHGTEGCSAREAKIAGNIAALPTFNRIATAVGRGDKLERYEDELRETAKSIGAPWQILDALADLARARRDYARAATLYQQALLEGADVAITPEFMAPGAKDIKRMMSLAGEMRLASPTPVPMSRGGCALRMRSIVQSKVVSPVRFEFGKVDFTEEGQKAADELAACLRASGASRFRLIGHADRTGAPAFNLTLSQQRAERLRDYLQEKGVSGAIEAEGHGDREPFKPADPGEYDEETLHRLSRRVEVEMPAP